MSTSELRLDCVVASCTFSTPTLERRDYQAMVEHLKLHYQAVHQNQGEGILRQLPQVGSQIFESRTPEQDGMGGGEEAEVNEQEVESTEQHDVVTEEEEYKELTDSETGSTPSVEPLSFLTVKTEVFENGNAGQAKLEEAVVEGGGAAEDAELEKTAGGAEPGTVNDGSSQALTGKRSGDGILGTKLLVKRSKTSSRKELPHPCSCGRSFGTAAGLWQHKVRYCNREGWGRERTRARPDVSWLLEGGQMGVRRVQKVERCEENKEGKIRETLAKVSKTVDQECMDDIGKPMFSSTIVVKSKDCIKEEQKQEPSRELTEKQDAYKNEVAVSEPEQKPPKVVVKVNLSLVSDQQKSAFFSLTGTAPLSKVISKLALKLGMSSDSLLLRVGEQELGREQEAHSVEDREVFVDFVEEN